MLRLVDKSLENLEVVAVDILPNHNKVDILSNGVRLEYITLKDTVCGETDNYVVEIGSNDWYALKCVEIPQKIAKKQKSKGGKHFEESDLISFLTEEAYKKIAKFDKEKVEYFESFMRRWLGKNVVDFFRDTKIDKITDLEVTFMAKNTDEEESNIEVFDEPIDIWAELHSEMELEEIISSLEAEEQIIARRLLDGYNASEIARELGTYKMKVSRHIQAIVKKAGLEKRQGRTTSPNTHIKSTVSHETTANVKRYNRLMDRLALENKILHHTVKAWAMDNKLAKEIEKLESLEGEAKFIKEAEIRSKCEVLDGVYSDLLEMEKKLEKYNK